MSAANELKAVRALREALEYRADGFPLCASHIQDRLDIVQAEVNRMREPPTANDTSPIGFWRQVLIALSGRAYR